MGQKRLKKRRKWQSVRHDRGKRSQVSPQAGQGNPFDDFLFWLRLATIDFSGLFGITIHSHEEQPPNKRID
jgi:hypothetical protein